MNKLHSPNLYTSTTFNISRCFMLLGFVLIFQVVGQFVGISFLTFYANIPSEKITSVMKNPANTPNIWLGLMELQGIFGIIAFILSGVCFWKIIERKPLSELFYEKKANQKSLVLIFFLMITIMPLIATIGYYNKTMALPSYLHDIEIWIKEKEVDLGRMSVFLTNFSSFVGYLLGVIVIALIPSIGEEIIFRGLFQRYFSYIFKNKHIAIWATAFLFSAIHFQFYGFFPRLLLGALLGYIYQKTGSLVTAIWGHFLNNFIAISGIYFLKGSNLALDSSKSQKPDWIIVIVFSMLAFFVYDQFKKANIKTIDFE